MDSGGWKDRINGFGVVSAITIHFGHLVGVVIALEGPLGAKEG